MTALAGTVSSTKTATDRSPTAASPGAQTPVTSERLMKFVFAYAPPLMVDTAVSLNLFDLLDAAPATVEQVSSKTGASERGLRILMNALVGLELLTKDAQGRYSLTPESETFLVKGKPGFLGGLFHHSAAEILPKWMQLNEVVLTGRAGHGGQ